MSVVAHHATPPRDRRALDELARSRQPAPEPRDPAAEREALLNRLCMDGGHTAALALRCLHQHSPKLAAPILEHFARLADETDDLECRLLDHMAREVRAREAA